MKKILATIWILSISISSFAQKKTEKMNTSERYERGWEKLKEVDGESGEKVISSLKDISPDLSKYIIEYAFGDIYAREGLDLKSKEIAVVAALTAMGTAQPQLRVHIHGALNTGSSINEVKEVILQMSAYAGFPSTINSMNALKEVLEERKAQGHTDEIGSNPTPVDIGTSRREHGAQILTSIAPNQVKALEDAFNDFSPYLVDLVLEYGFSDILSRDNLDIKHRELATIAALTAMGNAAPQLKFHINAGLDVGLTVENIESIMLMMTIYAGFPAAINGMQSLKEVVQERKK